MTSQQMGWLDRRQLLGLLGAGASSLALPARAFAQARKDTLVLGIDISDTITLDPARLAQYTSPMTVSAAYDSLVTMKPGEYINVAPSLATKWARTPDGKGWRFTLREGVKFSTGNAMTVEDVKWSFDRVINLGDQPSQYIAHVDRVEIVDKSTIDIILKQPAEPLLTIIAAPEFVVHGAQGAGSAGRHARPRTPRPPIRRPPGSTATPAAPAPTASPPGSATSRSSSCATSTTGAASRRSSASSSATSATAPRRLLAVRRGDIDAAFNLIPEQIAALKSEPNVRLAPLTSLDFVYMALTQEPEFNKALAVKEARQAIGYAIDYDGIKNSMLGGAALRPAHFLPIGVSGSTEEIARQIGFRQDLDKAKELLAKAGFPGRFRVRDRLRQRRGAGRHLSGSRL